IRGLACLMERRRLNRLAEYQLQIGELRQGFVARPGFIEALDRNWNNRSLRVNRENRRTLTKYPQVAVVGALALRIEDQNVSLAQAKSPGAHGGHQVSVRIEDRHAKPARQPPHESCTKNVARAQCKGIAKQAIGQRPRHHQWINIALVIRTDQVGTFFRQILETAHFEAKPVERKKINQFAQQKK